MEDYSREFLHKSLGVGADKLHSLDELVQEPTEVYLSEELFG